MIRTTTGSRNFKYGNADRQPHNADQAENQELAQNGFGARIRVCPVAVPGEIAQDGGNERYRASPHQGTDDQVADLDRRLEIKKRAGS